ncbi:MAG: HNH endonuclease [Planctomycetia bacterium]|nr:HNH endonuclease [Planctomycetia bacterium]
MADRVPDDIAARILAKCGRCCCICRRFDPTMLQVHHILLRSEGGTNDEDNLIALCITCHSDVHTERPFTRRFSVAELKLHREQVCRLVQEGKLVPATRERIQPSSEDFRTWAGLLAPDRPLIPRSFTIASGRVIDPPLSAAAVEMLLAAASSKQGDIIVIEAAGGLVITAGDHELLDSENAREAARFRAALAELQRVGLCEYVSRSYYRITYDAFLIADAMMAFKASTAK